MSQNEGGETMNRKIGRKIIAVLLITIMLLAYTTTIGIYMQEIYATANSLEMQGVKTNNENVTFDAYFTNEKVKMHKTQCKIGEENNINLNIGVKNAGYLKNAKVEFTAEDKTQANFSISMPQEETKQITNIDTNTSKVSFNQINKEQEVNVTIPISFSQTQKINPSCFSKQNIAKLTGTYIDENGKEKSIKAEIKIQIDWTQTPEVELEEQILRYMPYTAEETGYMLQTVVKSSVKNNVLPVKEEKIEIQVPIIANTKPTKIKVVAQSTKGTNGEEQAQNFNEENYNYNEQTGKLTINVANKIDEQQNITWEKQAKDEFIVTYLYPQTIMQNTPEEGNIVNINTVASITTYGTEEITINKEINQDVILKEQIGNILDINVATNVETLSKGYIYSNYNAIEKHETEYEQYLTANIGLTDATNNILVYSNTDNFVIDENTKGLAKTYIKEVSITEEEFNKFLGEEGFINIKAGEQIIDTINKEKTTIDIAQLNMSEIIMETSKPLKEGNIVIKVKKAIKTDIEYSKEQMKKFTQLEVISSINNIYASQLGEQKTANKLIQFTEPTSQAELEISNKNLSTVVVNENVEIKAILKTNSLDCNLYKNPTIAITLPSYIEEINVKDIQVLFDKELTIKNANLVQNEDGTKQIVLELQGTQTQYNIGNIAGGTNIVITADIKVNKLTPNVTSQITMNYTNENIINVESTKSRAAQNAPEVEQYEIAQEISFSAPVGIVTMNEISGYKEGASPLMSINGEEKVAEIPILSEEKETNFNMSVMNNYTNTIENVSILGRTPFEGNKSIETDEDLGSTMDLNLTTPITVNGVDQSKVAVYYSENGEATRDLNIAENGWTTQASDLNDIKSYLIVTNDYAMQTGDAITFNYNANLEEGLEHNQSSFETYAVYFTNNLAEGVVEDKQETARVGVTTGTGPVLQANITSNVKEGETAKSGSLVKYTVEVKNTGDVTANNVVASIPLGNYLEEVDIVDEKTEEYKNITTKELISRRGLNIDETTYSFNMDKYNIAKIEIGNIEKGKTITKDLWVKVDRLVGTSYCTDESHYETVELKYPDGSTVYNKNLETGEVTPATTRRHKEEIKECQIDYKQAIQLQATIIAENLEKEVKSNAINSEIKNSNYEIEHYIEIVDEEFYRENSEVEYNIEIKKYSGENNLTLEVDIPKEVEYQKAELNNKEIPSSNITYNNSTNKLEIKLQMQENEIANVVIYAKIKETNQEAYSKEVAFKSSVYSNSSEKESTNEAKFTIAKSMLKAEQTSTIPAGTTLQHNEEFSYKIKIESVGSQAENYIDINIEDYLPEEVVLEKVTQKELNKEEQKINYTKEEGKVKIYTSVQEGTSKEIQVYVRAIAQDEETQITNKVTIATENGSNIPVNDISHKIEEYKYTGYIEDGDSSNNGNNNSTITKKISGQVWLDNNKDGKKDEEETKISDVRVMLLNNKTGNFVTEQNTTQDGKYEFTQIPQGKYTVIFVYDTANYSSTSYQKQGIDTTQNSDAIDTQITLDGKKITAAITEEISVANSNIYNIDLGLIVNPKFDLKLDKTVSKITVQNSAGTNTYNYNDTKLAKRDIPGKQISSTTVVIEYKIKVTNEGAISGYVKKIADYIPSELKFSSELNRDWYQGENGAIYNASLSNTLINPGETKEVTLLLTKKLTSENIGLINNTAEIYEAYNDLGIADTDSTPANKNSQEDDQSSADVLLTVKTGETILFVGLALGIIGIIATSSIIIGKKVLK